MFLCRKERVRKKCSCQILEVEGKTVSGPGDTKCFIYLFVYLFIYFCDGKRVTTKSEKK